MSDPADPSPDAEYPVLQGDLCGGRRRLIASDHLRSTDFESAAIVATWKRSIEVFRREVGRRTRLQPR